MPFTKSIALSLALLTSFLVSACDGEAADAVSRALLGGSVVLKGPVSGATVCVYEFTGGVKGAAIPLQAARAATGQISGNCYLTGPDGQYGVTLPEGVSGPVLVEASAGQFCSTGAFSSADACMAGGTAVSLSGLSLSGVADVAPGATATAHVTPLTSAALQAAATPVTPGSVQTAFDQLVRALAGAGSTLTWTTTPSLDSQPFLGTAGDAIQAGTDLASILSQILHGSSAFPHQVPATVDAGLAGPYSLIFYDTGAQGCGNLCPYTHGQEVAVSVFTDGRIALGAITLSAPMHYDLGSGPQGADINWYDAARDLEFRVSDNQTGMLARIRIYKGRQTEGRLLGTLTSPKSGAQLVLMAIAGNYLKAQQYRGADVAWTGIGIGWDGRITFTGGAGPAIMVPTTVTMTPLGGDASLLQIQSATDINGADGVTPEDRISLYLDQTNHVKDVEYLVGPGSGADSARGVTLRRPGDAAPPAIPLGNWDVPVIGAAATVRGTYFAADPMGWSGASVVTGFEVVAGLSYTPLRVLPYEWKIRVDGPLELNRTYSCVQGDRKRLVQFTDRSGATAQTYSSAQGGNCSIVITGWDLTGNVVTAIRGRFTAELFGPSRNDSSVVLDGTFWAAPITE